MNTLLQATVTPKFIDPPKEGKKNWRVKDANNEAWSIPANLKDKFAVGQPIDIAYEDTSFQGKTFHMVKDARPAAAQAQAPAPQTNGNGHAAPTPAPAGNGYARQPTPLIDAERMFVCGAVNAAIQSGRLDLTTASVAGAVNAMRDAWAATFGTPDDSPPY